MYILYILIISIYHHNIYIWLIISIVWCKIMFAAPARLREGCRWVCLLGTPGKHPSNLLTTTKKTRQAPPRPLQQLPLYPRQQVPPLGESSSLVICRCSWAKVLHSCRNNFASQKRKSFRNCNGLICM